MRNSNQDNLQVFRKICTEQGYTDIGFVKVELSNPVYFFKLNRGQYEVKLGYHQSKYDNNDILRYEVLLNGKLDPSTQDFIIWKEEDLLNNLIGLIVKVRELNKN